MEMNIENKVRGVRIIAGDEAKERRQLLNSLIELADAAGFSEIILPSIEPAIVYESKAGAEVLEQMYVFNDRKDRQLCLRPEGTATIQLVANKYYPQQKDVKLWYFERCWRYERPQSGRYREFFQFGVEWINPRNPEKAREELIELGRSMIAMRTEAVEVAENVKRGLSYYVADGFEIAAPELGAQKQVLGGGSYKEGIGFAIGFDRLMLCSKE